MKTRAGKKRTFSSLRSVSDLRTQYLCEYRLHLEESFGESSPTQASRIGERLHADAAARQFQTSRQRQWLPLAIAFAAAILGLFWILG